VVSDKHRPVVLAGDRSGDDLSSAGDAQDRRVRIEFVVGERELGVNEKWEVLDLVEMTTQISIYMYKCIFMKTITRYENEVLWNKKEKTGVYIRLIKLV